MSRLTRRVALKPRQTGGDGYAAFLARITTLATLVTTDSDYTNGAHGLDSGEALFTYTGATPTFFGSSWGALGGGAWLAQFGGGAAHGFPSEAVRLSQIGKKVLLRFERFGSGAMSSWSRNGIDSLEAPNPTTANYASSRLLYFDPVLGAMEMNPRYGLGPTPYTWP